MGDEIRVGLCVYRLAGHELVGGIARLYTSYDDNTIDGIVVIFFDENGFFTPGEVSMPLKVFESSLTIHKDAGYRFRTGTILRRNEETQ